MITARPRVLSGIQPTGKLHIGNYIGALSVWAREQDRYDGLYCIVDLHALTLPDKVKPAELHDKTWQMAAIYLAAGLDPAKSRIFVQSMVSEHAELGWILTCMTPLGWAERMTQFKSKSTGLESTGTGLLCYPILQAADILLYDAALVPVGEDQRQHLELTRDVATRFNNMFGDVFTLPEPLIGKVGARIMGLDDPTAKMSKSVGEVSSGHAIGVVDEPEQIVKAIRGAVTDSRTEVDVAGACPGVRNLLTIYQCLTHTTDDQVRDTFEGKGYGFLKKEIADAVCAALLPVRTEYKRLIGDRAHLRAIVQDGADHAGAIASAKLRQVRAALGIDFGTARDGGRH